MNSTPFRFKIFKMRTKNVDLENTAPSMNTLMRSQSKPQYRNMMFDGHVVRGSSLRNGFRIVSKQSKVSRTGGSLGATENILSFRGLTGLSVGTNTDPFLVNLGQSSPQQSHVALQTDSLLYLPRAPNAPPVQAEATHCSTQVDTVLLDFDVVSGPVVRALLNNVLEGARMEVLEELEFAAMEIERRDYQQRRATMRVELERLREKQLRYEVETARREDQGQKSNEMIQNTHKKLTCRLLARQLVSDRIEKEVSAFVERDRLLGRDNHQVHLTLSTVLMEGTLGLLARKNESKEVCFKVTEEVQAKLKAAHQQAIQSKKNVEALKEELKAQKKEERRLRKEKILEEKRLKYFDTSSVFPKKRYTI